MRHLTFFKYIAMPLMVLMLGCASLSATACAADLHAAKAAGLIGEQPDGYLGLVSGAAGADVRTLVVQINGKRRAHYQGIAAKNGTSLAAVEQLAGKTAQARTPAGQYIMDASGRWRRK